MTSSSAFFGPVRLSLLIALALPLLARAETVAPTKGQSPEQTQKDIAECQAVAKQATGSVPAPPPPVAAAPPQAGGRVRGAAAGAAAGAVAAEVRGQQHEAYDSVSDDAKQEYRQNQAKSTAAAGAVVGASKQRRDRREAAKTQQEQAAQTQSASAAFQQSYQGCLLGRGYSITP